LINNLIVTKGCNYVCNACESYNTYLNEYQELHSNHIPHPKNGIEAACTARYKNTLPEANLDAIQ
jgi:hypothetical protein